MRYARGRVARFGVTAQIVRRFALVAKGDETASSLLARVGLSVDMDATAALAQNVDIDAYYDLLERAGDDDPELPYRYAASIRPEDFGALGLALKTAVSVRQALERVSRYILVLSNSLQYELTPNAFVLQGRPHHRHGACLANEGALGAAVSLLRQVAAGPVHPSAVSFQHAANHSEAQRFFQCPVSFSASQNALHFDADTLAAETRLGDEGLSSYLLERLQHDIDAKRVDDSVEAQVHRAVADALCDGLPSSAQVAARLGMSDRTLRRRLGESALTFRDIANRAQREVAESLLCMPQHSIGEVAFLAGFSDQSAFQRAFKRWSGQTPLAFRRSAARP